MKKAIARLPDAELDIMLVLWQLPVPARVIDLYNGLRPIRPCTRPTIHNLLDRLEERGFVKMEIHACSQPYKLITPLISEEEYRAVESRSFLQKLCRGRWQSLIAALIDTDEISADDLDEISAILEKRSRS